MVCIMSSSSSSSSTSLNILAQYLSSKCFYNRISYANSNIGIYYNSFVFDVISVIPFDFKDAIAEVTPFSDYIILIADSTGKINHDDKTIGIIYIDAKNHSDTDSINIVRLPSRHKTDYQARLSLLTPAMRDVYMPFWVKYGQESDTKESPAPKDPAKAKELIERAIQNYCSKNNLSRSDIVSYSQFIDHIAPDIFKYKMTVNDEMQLRKEADLLDSKAECYPEVLLKASVKLELLK